MNASLSAEMQKLLDSIVSAAFGRACETLHEPLAEIRQRLASIERRMAILENVEGSRQGENLLARSASKICEQCDRRAVARGLCSAHYQQRRYRQKKTALRRNNPSVQGAPAEMMLDDDLNVPRELNS